MEFEIPCDCGIVHVVRQTEAGSKIKCKCGREVQIPTLAQLRRSVGLVGVELSAAEQIANRVADGRLPNPKCIVCNGAGDVEIQLFAECEKSHQSTTKSYGWASSVLATVLLPGIWLWWEETTEIHGRDTVVPIPMKFCNHCRSRIPRFGHFAFIKFLRIVLLIATIITLVTRHHFFWYSLIGFLVLGALEIFLRNLNRSNCKSLMNNVDEYSKLLDDFPEATITY